MLSKITDQRIQGIIIIVFLVLQFALLFTDHQRLTGLTLGSETACDHPFANATETPNR